MGNRAIIQFGRGERAPAVYLHWNGGRASVEAFLDAARILFGPANIPPDGACDYEYARFVQIVANWLGGTSSIGAGAATTLPDAADNGTYIVGGDWQIVDRIGLDDSDNVEEIDEAKTRAITRAAIGASKPFFATGDEHACAQLNARLVQFGLDDGSS